MNRSLVFALSGLLSVLPAIVSAGGLTAEESAFFKQRESEMMRMEIEARGDPAIKNVFSTPIHRATVILPP